MQFDRDLSTVQPATAPEALATGWYPANITSAQEKPTKAGTGSLLEIKYKLQNNNKTLTSRHNVKNQNPQAVDIAYQEIAAIANSVGFPKAQTAQQLVGGPLELYVVKVPRDDKPAEMTNDVKGFRAIGAGGPVGFTGATGTQATAAPAWAQPAPPVQAGYAPPPQPVYAPPVAAAPAQPAWAPPPQPAAAQPPQYAPPPAAPAAPAAPAGAVPPWAR